MRSYANLVKTKHCPVCEKKEKAKRERNNIVDVVQKILTTNNNIDILGADYYINNKSRIYCKCKICGEEWNSSASHLMHGRGCPNCAMNKFFNSRRLNIDIIKERMYFHNPNIEIISGDYINQKSKIKCRCNICGTQWETVAAVLASGGGCGKCNREPYYNSIRPTIEEIKKEFIDNDMQMELLSDKYVNISSKLHVKCKKCNNKWYVSLNQLRSNKSGCPRCRSSIGEKTIHKILKDNKIDFIPQYKTPDCKNKKELPFDFYLTEYDIFIEYDGIQHYEPTSFGCSREEEVLKNFNNTLMNDEIKNQYCSMNNKILIRVPYYEDTSKFFINKLIENNVIKERKYEEY